MKQTKNKLGKIVASLAYSVSKMSANSRCVCIYHQTNKPEGLKALAKFKSTK